MIYPKIFGGHCFSQYNGSDQTWKNFPKSTFHFPECLATLTDDGSWLTISRIIYSDDLIDDVCEKFVSTKTFYENRLPVTLPPISRASVDKYKDIPRKKSTILINCPSVSSYAK